MQLNDVVIVALFEANLVGVVRIVNEHGIRVLRGMRIKPEFQRQGIGSKMLGEVRQVLAAEECFAIAYAHLETFYRQIGFRKVDKKEAPAFLHERIETYRKERPQQEFILIRRPAGPDAT